MQLNYSLTDFSNFLIMSTLANEMILENIYEEVIAEATDTGNIAMMTIEDVEFEVNRRFQDLSN